jgi:omega-amidase
MNILALQFDIVWEDKPANFATVKRMLTQAAPAPKTLVVLPEMFATGFSVNPEIQESAEGITTQFLRETACNFGVYLIGGRVVDNHNQFVTFSPEGELLCTYNKQYPFALGGETYTPGHITQTFPCESLTIAPFICYDLRFPEIFRAAAQQAQPELYIVIASWGRARIHHWVRLLQARAIENQAYVIGVNRIGYDPNTQYCGRSVIVDFHGEILADGGEGEAGIAATIDTDSLDTYRKQHPFLLDMRYNRA